jgi:hypothetical protein
VGEVRGVIDVRATPQEAEALWLDTQRWPSFLDGFGRLTKRSPDWPAEGARASWSTPPAGRGLVLHVVQEREPGVTVVLSEEDERITGSQRATFASFPEGCRMTVELAYTVKPGKGVPKLVDVLFVRRAMRESLRRTLTRFAAELELG